MRLKRLSFRVRSARRQTIRGKENGLIGRIEKYIIRFMVICAALLTVFQLRSITDPVDFYFKVAGDFDSPAFEYTQYIDGQEAASSQQQRISLFFEAEPESPVLVKQNDKVLGIIGKGITIKVEPGTVFLDASGIAYPVNVKVVYNQKSYVIELDNNMRSFDLKLKPNASL